MKSEQNAAIYLKDYTPPLFSIEHLELSFDLDPKETVVTQKARYKKINPHTQDLVLSGRHIPHLAKVSIDGRSLSPLEYQKDPESLTLFAVPESFELLLITHVAPEQNTALEGLYYTKEKFCTQCEAEGFRRITYFLDRPDVLTTYRVTLKADPKAYPVLLAGGNLLDQGSLDDGRHFAVWEDPYPKPSYLFALVAGDLGHKEDQFLTQSKRPVTIRIYSEHENVPRLSYAMQAVKDAMAWDERRFGLEYDLDIFMIVAVNDFNMGAMENKGLNIFNAKYILADPETATDDDYLGIQSVVGHEYFHNWTGNRVTCRDWFQLSLKEGLTVYRDQEFSADLGSEAVVRIKEVEALRRAQFPEDRSPMAHPIRPPSVIEINNFYTATVYNKGAEVIRMLATLLGRDGFRKGMDLYFQRHDGQAVTCDDFLAAMADANGYDLRVFKRWYDQAGTPKVTLKKEFSDGTLKLHLSQKTPKTPSTPEPKSLVIPLSTSLYDPKGNAVPFTYAGSEKKEHVLLLTDEEQTFEIKGLKEPPIVSTLRGFSAPVELNDPEGDADLFFLMSHDDDPFNRYEAAQKAAKRELFYLCDHPDHLPRGDYLAAFEKILSSASEGSFKALLLKLPPVSQLVWAQKGVSLATLFAARERMMAYLGQTFQDGFLHLYEQSPLAEEVLSTPAMAARALQGICLSYLATTQGGGDLLRQHYQKATLMTERMAALGPATKRQDLVRDDLLQDFYSRFHQNPLVLDKWFALIAGAPHPQNLSHIEQLLAHKDFDLLNPNRVYSVLRAQTPDHPYGLYHDSGIGFQRLAQMVLKLDATNPSVAARVVTPLGRFDSFLEPLKGHMLGALEFLEAAPSLSKDVDEIVSKSLKAYRTTP